MELELATTVALPPERVHEMLTSRLFQEKKALEVGAGQFEMTRSRVDSRDTVVTTRRMASVRLPEFVKALVEPTLLITETEQWEEPTGSTRSRHGAFDIDVKGAPVRFRGSVHLELCDEGTRLRYEGVMLADVPLFRRQVAEAAVGPVRDTIQAEFQMLHNYAARAAEAGPRN